MNTFAYWQVGVALGEALEEPRTPIQNSVSELGTSNQTEGCGIERPTGPVDWAWAVWPRDRSRVQPTEDETRLESSAATMAANTQSSRWTTRDWKEFYMGLVEICLTIQ